MLLSNNEVKMYLRQVRDIRRSQIIKKDKIKQLQEQATKITVALTADVVQGGSINNNSFADAINATIDLRNQILLESYRESILTQKIFKQLSEMAKENKQVADILTAYYLNFWSWERVCSELSYSWRSVHRLHKKGLEMFKRYM